MVDVRSLRHLTAVVKHQTVRDAAESLSITQPALTKSIARLEGQLGTKLFDRESRKLVLTELGQRVVARSEVLIRQMRQLEEEVDLWNNLESGEVNIGVDADFDLEHLSAVIESFVPANPNVQVNIQSGYTETLLPGLFDGHLHFLVADPEIAKTKEDLEIQPLATDYIVAAVRFGHPLASIEQPTSEDLIAYPFAGAATAPRFDVWKLESGMGAIGKPFNPSLLCDNYEVLIRLAEKSDSVAFGPQRLLQSYERQGRIQIMPWDLSGPAIEASIISMRDRYLSPAASRLIDLFERYQGNST